MSDKPIRMMDWADHYRSLGPGLRYEEPMEDSRTPVPVAVVLPVPVTLVGRILAWWRKGMS